MMRLSIIIFLVSLLAVGCRKPSTDTTNEVYPLKLTFVNKVGTSNMQLGSNYTNASNETYRLTAFKYYISNIELPGNGRTASVENGYFLVDEATPSTKSFTVNLTASSFSALTFLIGVDSARNVSGTQTGDLDPAKGMFWTWNSGYVMAKLEGTSPLSTAPANSVSLHVGGFRTGENAVRRINLPIPGGTLNLAKDKVTEVVIEADANAFFTGDHTIRIAQTPLCHSPGALAVKIGDNYSKMFKIVAVN